VEDGNGYISIEMEMFTGNAKKIVPVVWTVPHFSASDKNNFAPLDATLSSGLSLISKAVRHLHSFNREKCSRGNIFVFHVW